MLAEIGRIVTTWACIEQQIILSASALASQKTDGWPIEHLRMDFKRLREKWYSLAAQGLDQKTINKQVHPLNIRLAALSVWRNYVMHGIWHVDGPGRYRLTWWEQKGKLERYEAPVSLTQLRALANELLGILSKLDKLAAR